MVVDRAEQHESPAEILMPNSSTTAVIDTASTTSSPCAWAYGYVWATGKRESYFELQNTGDHNLDFTRIGFWILGEGEWDGCEELWINDQFVWKSEFDDPAQFHFHRGTDAVIGSGLVPSSSGPDQGCDSFWSWFPSAVQPLCFSRMAYYGIFRKQPIENQTNNHQNDPTQWTDIAPIGLWRGLRVRIFDDQGNQSGYAFSTNPVWQWVDMKLRRKLFPEYGISLANGADPIPAAVQARFNWGDIYASAQYCNQIIQTGIGPRPRFRSNCAFNQQTTLAAMEEQVLKVCRGYTKEYAGKFSFLIDQPRNRVFTFNRTHILPGTFSPSDKTLSAQPNVITAKMRDLLVPASAKIASIACADHHNPVVTTEDPHPYNTGDRIAIGGTDTLYDGVWTVANVPAGTQVTTLTLGSKGSNYPTAVGTGGVIGLLYSRFKERAPTFFHNQNQYAKGAVGVGLPRYLNPVPATYDMAVCTFDQASRIARYERDLSLGFDVTPYVAPQTITFRCPMYALDGAGSGAAAAQLECGDRVALDSTANYAYQGDYQIMKIVRRPYTARPSGSGSAITLTADPSGGQMEITLGPYSEPAMYDYTDPNSASWSNVPGSDPGNDGQYTGIDLADGGTLAFITGAVPTGSTFDLPSSGFSPSNFMAWAGPQGYREQGNDMHVIAQCDVNPTTRVCTLQYEDGQLDFWGGDVNFAALTWMGDSTAATFQGLNPPVPGTMNWLFLTLAGGEQVCFGEGVMADGAVVQLPAGFAWYASDGVTPKAFAVAYPHDASPNEPGASGNQATGVGAYVDYTSATVGASGGGVPHLNYQDNVGHVWHGNTKVLVFAWKNNSGTVAVATTGGMTWMTWTTSTNMVLGVGVGTFADGAAMGLPAAAGAGNSLQAIAGPRSFTPEAHPAHGVGACYVDGSLVVHMFFEDGQGHQWGASADVFALFYEPAGGSGTGPGGINVTVAPAGAVVPPSATQQFTAIVTGTSNTAVTWSVDGIAGGNAAVGTIDGTGLYTAPATNGTHLITATSAANNAAQGSQFVQVGTGGSTGGGGTSGTITVTVTPGSVSLPQGGQQQFSAAVTGGGSPAIVWAVNGIVGGDPSVGTIDATGLYTAPNASGGASITATVTVSGANYVGGAGVTFGNPGGPYGGGRLMY